MNKPATLFAAALWAVVPVSSAQVASPPVLNVPADGIATLNAGRHEFSGLTIAKNGRLNIVPRGASATQIIVRGNVYIEGFVTSEAASSSDRDHAFALPDGRTVTVNYRSTNRGGDGGDGDFAGANAGGRSAAGTPEAGGGGGSGATTQRVGMDASGRRGGGRVPACGAYGGAGGTRDPAGAGGTLYLEVHGDFYGSPSTGYINLKGANGADGIFGENHQAVTSPAACEGVPGGGGGGAPGNPGGHLVVWVSGRILSYPNVFVTGGTGGRAGAGGVRKVGGIRAQSGTDGQDGASGSVQWFMKLPAN